MAFAHRAAIEAMQHMMFQSQYPYSLICSPELSCRTQAWAKGSMSGLSHEWQEQFLGLTAGYDRSCSPQESAEMLRIAAKSGLLRYTDMRDAPERFFAAHRLLASKIL